MSLKKNGYPNSTVVNNNSIIRIPHLLIEHTTDVYCVSTACRTVDVHCTVYCVNTDSKSVNVQYNPEMYNKTPKCTTKPRNVQQNPEMYNQPPKCTIKP